MGEGGRQKAEHETANQHKLVSLAKKAGNYGTC